MKYACLLIPLSDGRWLARHSGSALGMVEVTAATRDAARVKLRDELQYRIELCPCSGVSGDTVVLEEER